MFLRYVPRMHSVGVLYSYRNSPTLSHAPSYAMILRSVRYALRYPPRLPAYATATAGVAVLIRSTARRFLQGGVQFSTWSLTPPPKMTPHFRPASNPA
eukprot:2371578-Rhodomonas_salina.1